MISYKKTDKPDYKWLQVTTSDYKWLRTRIRVTTGDYKWVQVTTSDYEPEYELLQVTTSQTKIKMPQLWMKRIFSYKRILAYVWFQTSELLNNFLYDYSICETRQIWLISFWKKLLYAASFVAVALKKVTNIVFKTPCWTCSKSA